MVNTFCWRAFQLAIAIVFCGVCTAGVGADEITMPMARESLLQRLDPTTRAKVLMSLLGLILLGITMIAAVCIGARYVRRTGTTLYKRRAPAPIRHRDIVDQQFEQHENGNTEDPS